VWRRKAEQDMRENNYSFVRCMLDHVKMNNFNSVGVFKVIAGATVAVKQIVSEVGKEFSAWSFSSELALRRTGLVYKLCKVMFGSFNDYLEKIKIYENVRLAQVEAWSVEILQIDCYKNLNHQELMVEIFGDGLVDVNKALKYLRDERQARLSEKGLLTSDNPVVMGAYISLALKVNGYLKSSNSGWLWESEVTYSDDGIITDEESDEDKMNDDESD